MEYSDLVFSCFHSIMPFDMPIWLCSRSNNTAFFFGGEEEFASDLAESFYKRSHLSHFDFNVTAFFYSSLIIHRVIPVFVNSFNKRLFYFN